MAIQNEIAALFRRDLTRVIQELQAFPDEHTLWQTTEGVTNSAGNLVLHLEGNLREYVGRQLGAFSYERHRAQEFSGSGVPVTDLIKRMEEVREIVNASISRLTTEQLDSDFPDKISGSTLSKRMCLMHLFGHLNYHLGQIDYLRRFVTKRGAVPLASL